MDIDGVQWVYRGLDNSVKGLGSMDEEEAASVSRIKSAVKTKKV